MIAFKRNKNVGELIGGNTIKNNKVQKSNEIKRKGKCTPCYSNNRALCCKQLQNTETFKSFQTKQTFRIYHHLSCKSKYIIYLMECNLCKIQYVGKSETSFNIRLNNHRKDTKNTKSIPADSHFRKPGHDFTKNARFILIEQLNNIENKSKESLRLILKRREDFWIKKLETLKPKGLNQELNNV